MKNEQSKPVELTALQKNIWNEAIEKCMSIVQDEIRISNHNKGMMLHKMIGLKK